MADRADAGNVGEAILHSGAASVKALVQCMGQLAMRGRVDDGDALLDMLVAGGHLSLERAQQLRDEVMGKDTDHAATRVGSVRQLAEQLRVHALPTLIQNDERSLVPMPGVGADPGRQGPPPLMERPTNRARRILLETRVAVGGKGQRTSGTGDLPTRVLAGSHSAGRVPGPPTPVSLGGPSDAANGIGQGATLDDKYLVGERIGRGGMGDVHVARDLDLGRDVALKTLSPENRADETLIRALIHEARLTGQLQHPNIIPVYELGLLSSGRVYYTMKLISESNLQDALQGLRAGDEAAKTEYTTHRLLNIFQRLCNALHYAHARSVIHRDVKPDNVLLGSYGEVQLMDWGIATIIGRPELSSFADYGVVAGTPQYMSPEQASGDVSGLDARSDIYSLGVILYEMLTLQLPIDIPIEVTEPRDVAAYKRKPILPPHRRAPLRQIPRELSEICMRALAHDREARQPDARTLWRQIEEHLEGTKEQERLRQRARREVARGAAATQKFRTYLAQLESLKVRVEEMERTVSPWAPESERRELWDCKNRRQGLNVIIGQSFADAVMYYQRALGNDPANDEARRALSELYTTRVKVAEREGDVASLVYFEGTHRELWPDRNRHMGQISIRSSPEGAQAYLFRADELAAALPFDDVHRLGTVPLHHVDLSPGSYLVVGRLPGYRDVHQIVTVRSGEHNFYMLLLSDWSEEVPLVGRVDELARLRFAHRQLAETGRLRAVLVSGSSGAGKGRIISAFNSYISELPEAYLYLYVHCNEPNRYVAFSALAGLLRHRLGAAPDDEPARVMARLLDLIAYALCGAESVRDVTPDDAAEVKRLAGIIGRIPGLGAMSVAGRALGQTGLRQSIFEATLELFDKLSRRMPLVVVLRSVHFTDGTSRAFFQDVLTRLGECPIMMVATTDPAYVRSDLLGAAFHEHISLGPLRAEAVAELLRELVRGSVDPELVGAVHAYTEGHAHAVEDVVRMLVQGRHLQQEGGAYTIKPTSKHLLAGKYDLRMRLDDRLRALGRPAEEALEAAAVLGMVFSAQALAALGIDDPTWAIQTLVDNELIARQPRRDAGGSEEYCFRHADVRRASLELLDPERRALLHYAAARWIESMGVTGDVWKARLATHLEGMGRAHYAAELYAELAESARAVGAFEDAARNFRQALDMSQDEVFSARIGLARLDVLLALDRHLEAVKALEQLVSIARHLDAKSAQKARDLALRVGKPELRKALERALPSS